MNTITTAGVKPAPFSRDYYIDNIKGVFIFLVVFGHLLDYLEEAGIPFAISVRTFIYFFHMPGFIFMSGYLAKSFSMKRFKGEKLLGFAWLYLLFKDSIELLHYVFDRPYFTEGTGRISTMTGLILFAVVFSLAVAWAYSRFPLFQCAFIAAVVGISLIKVNIFYVGAAPWYLMSLILWHIVIYLTQHMNPKYVMLASILMAAVLDYQEEIGKFLSLSRTTNFLPFFLLGFYMTREQFYKIVNSVVLRIILPVFFVVVMILVLKNGVYIRENFGVLLYAVSSFDVLPDQLYTYGSLLTLVWLAAATLLMFAVFILCPRKKSYLSTIGKATISIYVLHRLFKDILYYAGFYDILSSNPYIAVAEVAFVSLILVLIFGNPTIANIINRLGSVKVKWAYVDGKE
ncbi:MAG: acyltransferase family protein [Lachnospiraceae bacterium]|nr:acyltransferase family protein [Lachnospiraceae bacterium]